MLIHRVLIHWVAMICAMGALAMLGGCANQARGKSQVSVEVAVQLREQADNWDRAIVRKDRAAIEANMADEFRQIDGAGNIETKTSFVADLMSADLQIDPYTVEEFDVRIYGEVALLSGKTRMTGRYQGKPFINQFRYVDIYVRRAGGWKIVNVQISKMPN